MLYFGDRTGVGRVRWLLGVKFGNIHRKETSSGAKTTARVLGGAENPISTFTLGRGALVLLFSRGMSRGMSRGWARRLTL